jgi:hypothetical protein
MAAPTPPTAALGATSSGSLSASSSPPGLPALVAAVPAVETTEVRWWYDRPLPAELLQLCVEAAGPAGETQRRVDTYLTHCGDDVSVKIRGGDAVDIKQRCGPVTASVLVPGVQGRVEHWRKWTFPAMVEEDAADTTRAAAPLHETGAAQHWVPVDKTRCLVDEGSSTVELTEVRTPDRLHWTLALEVPVDVGLRGLRAAAAALELGRFPRLFGIDTSASYATFIEPPPPAGLHRSAPG